MELRARVWFEAADRSGQLDVVGDDVGGALPAARCRGVELGDRHDGPIVRVGDRMTVFSPDLTNDISTLMTTHAAEMPKFKWQRKLMAGGACEATARSL